MFFLLYLGLVYYWAAVSALLCCAVPPKCSTCQLYDQLLGHLGNKLIDWLIDRLIDWLILSLKKSSKFVHNFSSYPADRQTNAQRQKHNIVSLANILEEPLLLDKTSQHRLEHLGMTVRRFGKHHCSVPDSIIRRRWFDFLRRTRSTIHVESLTPVNWRTTLLSSGWTKRRRRSSQIICRAPELLTSVRLKQTSLAVRTRASDGINKRLTALHHSAMGWQRAPARKPTFDQELTCQFRRRSNVLGGPE